MFDGFGFGFGFGCFEVIVVFGFSDVGFKNVLLVFISLYMYW